MGVVCIFSAIFIIVLVASFAWVCVRALAFDDNLLDLQDNDTKQLREPLVEHIYAQDVKNSDIEVSTCVWNLRCLAKEKNPYPPRDENKQIKNYEINVSIFDLFRRQISIVNVSNILHYVT